MKQLFCRICDRITWHNACTKDSKPRDPRCVHCGQPKRFGAHGMKDTMLVAGKVMVGV